jgi:hypothetical protein
MRILVLQLKRLGDLILSTPALRALRSAQPEADIALAVAPGCAPLLGAMGDVDCGIVLGRGRGFAPWQQVLTGPMGLVPRFHRHGSLGPGHRGVARLSDRLAFAWVQRSKMRAWPTPVCRFSVRERHTVDHYLDLVRAAFPDAEARPIRPAIPPRRAPRETLLAKHGSPGHSSVHPAPRARKILAAGALGGSDRPSRAVRVDWGPDIRAQTPRANPRRALETDPDFSGQLDLLTLAALIERAALVLSCDTVAAHLAAAFQRPQIALFGPTNPFHWRPRHDRAVVFSAAKPDAPLREFAPRMKGAPMDRISTDAVICATKALLSA